MHNSTISSDRSPDDVVEVLEVEDDRLGRGLGIRSLLSYADIVVRLERLETALTSARAEKSYQETTYTVLP
jgi:arginine decarboxylase-like protein